MGKHRIMILKNDHGKLELRKDSGSLVCTIARSHVADADLNDEETHVAVVYDDGKCEILKINGNLERTIVQRRAVRVRWNGDDVAIGLDNGRTELRKMNGNLIRTI